MKKGFERLLALTTAAFLVLPMFPIHVHAAEEGGGETAVTLSGSSVSCNCNCITEPQMRALFKEYLSKEEVSINATMVYNLGVAPDMDALKNFQVYADIQSNNDLVDWSYYQPKAIENQWKNNIFSDSTIRAFNVLDNKAPIFYDIQFSESETSPTFRQLYPAPTPGDKAANTTPNLPNVSADPDSTVPPASADFIPMQQDASGYALAKKRSLIIMSIYKAMDVEFYNKPVIYSSLLGDKGVTSYPLLETPFFKQMSSADIKWNNYSIMNAMGRAYLFMDNNYLEAYMVKAVNDRVVSSADLAPEFLELIKKNYIPQGTNNRGTISGGNCNKYIMVNRNVGQGGISTPSYKQDDLGVVYNFGTDGSITFNPNFVAMNEEENCTLLEFCRYAYKIMYTNGAPVITAQEKSAMYSLLGARIPNTASQEDLEGLGYLVINGVIPETITSEELNAPITNESLLLYLSRIADENTKLTYSYEVSSTDIKMANAGFAQTQVTPIPSSGMPADMYAEVSEGTPNEYDYYIQKVDGLSATVRQDMKTQSKQYFTLNAPNIGSSWGKQVDDVMIGGAAFMHFKLPVKAPPDALETIKNHGTYYVMNSDDWSDEPMYICVPPGGGLYQYDKTVPVDDGDGGIRNISILKKVTTTEQVPGYWEGKPGADESKKPLPETVTDITKFAASPGTTNLSFWVKDYTGLRFAGVDLKTMPPEDSKKVFDKNGYKVSIELKEEELDKVKGWRVTCTVPSDQTKSISRMLSRTNESVDGYPAYLCRENGDLLVSSYFLKDKCQMNVIPRSSDNLITLISRSGSGVQTTLIKDKNVAVSGSTVIDFGSSVMFEQDGKVDDLYYINYKAVANQMAQSTIFISSDGTANVNIETVKYATQKISLATDNAVSFDIIESSTGKIPINMIPSPISSTLVLRKIGSMQDAPAVVQLKPVAGGKKETSASATSFFGSSSPISSNSLVEVPLSNFDYDAKTGMVWWDAPEESEYSMSSFLSGSIPVPIFKGGGGYVVANYPYLESNKKEAADLADYTSKFTVLSSIEDKFDIVNWVKDAEFMLKQQFGTGGGADVSGINGPDDYSYQLFSVGVPAYLHGVDDNKKSYKELVTMSEQAGQSNNAYPIILYLAGGFYAPVRQTSAPNDSSGTSPVKSIKDAAFIREISANRASALAAKSKSVCKKEVSTEGYIYVNPEEMFIPMQVQSASPSSTTPFIYISESEMMQVKLSGITSDMFGDDSVFGKLSAYSELVFDTVNRSELLRELRLSGLDGFLQIVYLCCLVILPRIFIISMFGVMCLSLVSKYKIYEWFANKVFDPIAIISFGLVKYTEIHSWFIFLSCGLGIMFLVLISRGTMDTLFFYFLDQFLSILSDIKTFYI